MKELSFRQIHLDFHTGKDIPEVGKDFNKKQFQDALQKGHVDAINIFAKCHHGWLYYRNGVSPSHPHLEGDLLDNMLEACREIGVGTQIYISAGLDEQIARQKPEWLFRLKDQSTSWAGSFMEPGYHVLCMNTPYLDYLVEQVKEVASRFETDGIWLDIVGARPCYCQTCMNQIIAEGNDPRDEKNILELGERVYKKYYETINKAVHDINPELRVFHNGGHIRRGRRDYMDANTHQELESLPTGGWGYDHFPLSARYVQGIAGDDFLGMTGKFHTTWGEFGGFKHPNALRYEAALNLANGAKMCIGDQLHPRGKMDEVTYGLIGEAYKEIEKKEAWCNHVKNIADIAVLTPESQKVEQTTAQKGKSGHSDAGVVRMLLEGKYLFDVIDTIANFDRYKVIILPDEITPEKTLMAKLETYVSKGGKLLVTGKSMLGDDDFMLDMGIKWQGKNPYRPDYLVPEFSYHNLGSTAFIMYGEGQRIEATHGEVLGHREDSYFNRDFLHFSSHFHTPNEPGKRTPGMVESDMGIYIAWNVFEDYALKGSLILKDTVMFALDRLLGENKTVQTNLGAQGVMTLQHQEDEKRYINHLLYATPVKRGKNVEVIEDMIPVYDIDVQVQVSNAINKVYLAPQMEEISFDINGNSVSYRVPVVNCHQMVVLEYK